MGRLRVYIETSVWSFAFAEDAPDYRADTELFFERCRQGVFDLFVSDVVLRELARAREPLRRQLVDLVADIHPAVFAVSADAERLAQGFVDQGVVPRGKPEDARHVAAAFDQRLDLLVSWNFKHIANVRRAERFNAVAVLWGYSHSLRIVSPAEVIYGDETDPA